jgi:hypothetical protein
MDRLNGAIPVLGLAIEVEETRPNGPDCPPVCREATITFAASPILP